MTEIAHFDGREPRLPVVVGVDVVGAVDLWRAESAASSGPFTPDCMTFLWMPVCGAHETVGLPPLAEFHVGRPEVDGGESKGQDDEQDRHTPEHDTRAGDVP